MGNLPGPCAKNRDHFEADSVCVILPSPEAGSKTILILVKREAVHSVELVVPS